MAFGRKGTIGVNARGPLASEPLLGRVDSDGTRRVFGEAAYAQHGDFLRAVGHDRDAASNVIPEEEDFDRLVAESRLRQELRRRQLEADLLVRHGCNAIRPFYLFGQVYNTPVGPWLIKVMRLLPFDEWNVTYLAMDAPTARALGVPSHPQQDIPAIDDSMTEHMTKLQRHYAELRRRADEELARTGDAGCLVQYMEKSEGMRRFILKFVAQSWPTTIAFLAAAERSAIRPAH